MKLLDFKSKEFRHTQWHWHEPDFDIDPESISMPVLDKLSTRLLSHSILSREDEWCLFRRLNFVKYKIFMDVPNYSSRMVVGIQNEIIQRNLRFIATLSNEKKIQVQDRFDLFQDAVLWMLDCVHAFNYKKNVRFLNYYAHAFHNNYCGWLKKREIPEKPFSVVSEADDFDVFDEKIINHEEQLETTELTENFKKQIKFVLDSDYVLGTILLLRFGLLDDKIWKFNEIALVVKTSPQAVQKRVVNWLRQRGRNGGND